MQLIDANELEEQGWIMQRTVAVNPQTVEMQIRKPTNFPTIIDAVPVVRCKDCRWKEQEQPGMVYCPATVGGWVDEDWFCNGGEKERRMKPYICPQCGGQVNRTKMICEYCGTQFREEYNEIRVVAYNPRVHTLGANVTVSKELVTLSPRETAELAIRRLSEEFASCIAQFMEVQTRDEPMTNEVLFRARLRVLDSGYRFEREERRWT